MRALDILIRTSGSDPFAGYTRLSSLLLALNVDDPLTIGSGSKLLVDVEMDDSDRLGQVTVSSGALLRFDHRINTRLLAAGIGNSGDFRIASEFAPLSKRAVIDLCGAIPTTSGNAGGGALKRGITHRNADGSTNFPANTSTGNNGTTNDNQGVSRGIINYAGGVLKLYGAAGPQARRLNAHYTTGTTLTLDAPVTAKAGAKVLVTPTGFFSSSTRTEVRALAADVNNSTTITINSALGFARWGALQYATDSGISLSPGTFSAMRTHADQSPVIDQRAFVCIVDRNIKIRGYDAGNTSLASEGFGMHGMTMGLTSKTVLNNVEFDKYGQLGLLARYAWHFHVPSYNADGTSRADGVSGTNGYAAGDALLDGCTFVDGFNRAFVWHACLGVKATRCIAYDSAGHSFFEEDGSEEGNESSYNVAIAPRDPGSSYRLKLHEATASGHWIANFNNVHVENWGVDCPGHAWWNAPSRGLDGVRADAQHGCLGVSSNVPIVPFFGKMGTWDGMSGLCTGNSAGITDEFPIDNGGNVAGAKIQTTTDGLAGAAYGNPNQITTTLKNARLFKGNGGGYRNRVSNPEYENWVCADNYGAHLSGATDSGHVQHPIVIRESLNHQSNYLAPVQCNAFATYHGTLPDVDVTAYGYSGGTPTPQGQFGSLYKNSVMESWDLYTDPLQMFSYYMPGWKLHTSAGTYQTPSPALVNDETRWNTYYGGPRSEDVSSAASGHYRWQLGVLYDHYGTLSQGPSAAGVANSFIVPNVPFYTTGLTTTAMPDTTDSVTTTTPFFGIFPYGDDTFSGQYGLECGMSFTRVDSSRVAVSGATLAMRDAYSGNDYDTGTTAVTARMGGYFNIFHHGVVPKDGIVKYQHTNQGSPNSTRWNAYIYATDPLWNPNANAADSFILGVPWANGTAPTIGIYPGSDTFTSVASFSALLSAAKQRYWRDTTNNLLWLKIGRPAGTLDQPNQLPPSCLFRINVAG